MWLRFITSIMAGQAVDTVVFMSVAFLGVLLIDTCWHTFLLFTREYDAFCRSLHHRHVRRDQLRQPFPYRLGADYGGTGEEK